MKGIWGHNTTARFFQILPSVKIGGGGAIKFGVFDIYKNVKFDVAGNINVQLNTVWAVLISGVIFVKFDPRVKNCWTVIKHYTPQISKASLFYLMADLVLCIAAK